MPRKPKKAEPKVGRPKINPANKFTSVNTTISPETRAYLTEIGGGSVSRGARIVLGWARLTNLRIPILENARKQSES